MGSTTTLMKPLHQLAVLVISLSLSAKAEEGRCALVFDFDGVIKTGEMSQSAEAVTVMEHAQSEGYLVGLATMSCEETFIRGFLANRISQTIFTEEMLDSAAAQFCEPSKPTEIERIVRHFGADPNCAVLYDDSIGNKAPVEDAGYVYIHTQAHVGITYELYNEGLEALAQRGCGCKSFTL